MAKLQIPCCEILNPHPRYSDTEEVRMARMGSVHARLPAVPCPSCTRATRVGIEGLRHKLRPNFSCCAALIASGQAGSGGPNSRGGTRGYDTNNDTTRNRADTLSPEVLEILVELVGIALLGGVDST